MAYKDIYINATSLFLCSYLLMSDLCYGKLVRNSYNFININMPSKCAQLIKNTEDTQLLLYISKVHKDLILPAILTRESFVAYTAYIIMFATITMYHTKSDSHYTIYV